MIGLIPLAMLQAASGFTAPPLPDSELARHRGGFRLPNGVDVALTVQTQTALNGAVVLRSVYSLDTGQPNFVVYTPKDGQTIASQNTPNNQAGVPVATTHVSYDGRGGVRITPGVAVAPVTIGSAATPQATDDRFAALPAGSTIVTGAGTVRQSSQAGLQTAELHGVDLSVTHLAGSAFGAAVVNAGNDRSIDTQTSLFISLGDAGPDVVGSSMLRAGEIAVDAAQFRVR